MDKNVFCGIVAKVLEENNVYATVWSHLELPVICVGINWGDWKHQHLRADHIVEGLGGNLIKTEVTEEDGSDTYSAIHYYVV